MNELPGATLFAADDLPCRAPEEGAGQGPVVEVSLLLPGWQVEALGAAAQREGRTFAEMARRLIHDFLRHARR